MGIPLLSLIHAGLDVKEEIFSLSNLICTDNVQLVIRNRAWNGRKLNAKYVQELGD